MGKSKNVAFMITIPKSYRDLLRTLAAERNLKNPDQIVTAAGLGKELLCGCLEEQFLANSKQKEEKR
ncbi:MAG TPA: hypothetical protein VMW89_08275 [Desulfatiglandales bacterium]|nr:hypothetical protein [Desulfatiglandales bacterium]